jgi:hypothetical protein
VPEPVLKAAQAHPVVRHEPSFDDGNGRITRAIADMVFAKSNRILEQTQRATMTSHRGRGGSLDVSPPPSMGRRPASRGSSPRRGLREAARRSAERSSAADQQPPTRRLRGQAEDLQVDGADEELAEHRATGYSAAGRAWSAGPQLRGGTEHQRLARQRRVRPCFLERTKCLINRASLPRLLRCQSSLRNCDVVTRCASGNSRGRTREFQ